MEEEINKHDEVKRKGKIAAYVLIALVVGLLIFSTMQTFQINSLEKNFISGGTVGGVTRASASSARTSGSSAPTMVGGC